MNGEIEMAPEDTAPAIDGEEAVPNAVAVAARRREVLALRAAGDRYSWLEDYLARLEGKEARARCYAWLG
jgi:hypothetical protein